MVSPRLVSQVAVIGALSCIFSELDPLNDAVRSNSAKQRYPPCIQPDAYD